MSFHHPVGGRAALAMAACAVALTACGGSSKPPPVTVSAQPVTGWAGRAEVGRAIALLNEGKAAEARTVLQAVLARQAGDPMAASLLRQIDEDPVALLGREHFAYTTRAGESMSGLAQRFLKDPTLFYALARYNGIAAPGALAAGQALRIPGKEAVPAPRKRAVEAPRAAASAKREPSRPAPAAAPASAPRSASPAQAARLRAAALEQMNRGKIAQAVGLLRQAGQADPANSLVRRDLDRALRIQRAVNARGK